ncbi:hypothetical protein [Sphaerisporangium dianthi]|uniref:DUF2029 domain-containing protein n=1 Tax=Sphaerisporangium dianthi TaxID=1436120 RepID=A0ABV9CCI3_9ACTN
MIEPPARRRRPPAPSVRGFEVAATGSAAARPAATGSAVPRSAEGPGARAAVAAWAGLIACAFAAGGVLHALGVLTIDHLPPLHAHFRVLTVTLLPAAAFAAVAVRALPRLTAHGGFGRALALSYGCALVWTVLLAVSAEGLAAPLARSTEYLAVLPAVGDDPLGWLRTFTERLPGYPTHVRGHPPLAVLLLWALARAGLPGASPASVLVVTVGCSATVAIGIVVRELAGESSARRALPYLALTPAAVWIATSMDAFFAGVGAWGVALLVLAGHGGRGRRRPRTWPSPLRRPRTSPATARGPREKSAAPRGARTWPAAFRPPLCGLAAGIVLGSLPYLSYGLVPYLLIPLVAGVVARVPPAAVAAALAGAGAVSAAFAAAGFLWPAGVLATHAEWAADPGSARPYAYFLVANLAVLALMTGPATAIGLSRLATAVGLSRLATAVGLSRFAPAAQAARPRRGEAAVLIMPGTRALAALVGAALVAVLALDVSGVTRGEVERIWVPYALWIGLAASMAAGRRRLAVQVVTGLALQALVVSPW